MKVNKIFVVQVLTLLSAGRAMTIPFIGRVGDGGPGDPPEAWLMPLIGDAIIGVTALVVLFFLIKRHNPMTWIITIAWNAVAAFDAIAAFMVDVASPWSEFFMLELFGRPMFFLAAAMHVVIIFLLTRQDTRAEFGIPGQLTTSFSEQTIPA